MRKVILFFGIIFFSFNERKERNYFKKEFNYRAITRIEPKVIHFDDGIPSDTLFACYTTNKFPHAYCREVFTNVCNGGECLPVWLFIYWSPGGAYLGYSLKDDNILTKERHVPFTEDDYEQLHHLLDNPQSLLKDYKLKEVEPEEPDALPKASVAKNKAKEYGNYTIQTSVLGGNLFNRWETVNSDTAAVDGVTGATDKEVKLFVVKGALYTTYTLWHTIYGATRDSIRAVSLHDLSPQFAETLLSSSNVEDNLYGLSVLNKFDAKFTENVLPRLVKFVQSDNFILKEKALNALKVSGISDAIIQKTLSTLFVKADFGTKQMLIDKLMEYDALTPESLQLITTSFLKDNSFIIQKIFKLLQKQTTIDLATKVNITNLLDDTNNFIGKIAYKYLSAFDNNDDLIKEKLKKYGIKNNLSN